MQIFFIVTIHLIVARYLCSDQCGRGIRLPLAKDPSGPRGFPRFGGSAERESIEKGRGSQEETKRDREYRAGEKVSGNASCT